MSNKLVNETIKENGNPANQGDPAPVPEGNENKDNGNEGNKPEVAEEVVKVGLFTRIGCMVDNAVSHAADAGKTILGFAKKHPIATAGGAAGLAYGGYKLYKAFKGDDPAGDDVIDADYVELPAVPEVPQIPVQEATVIPQVEIPEVPEVETVQEVLEGPTEGIFNE